MKRIITILLVCVSIQMSGQCWQKVSAGDNHSIGLKSDGTLWAWGNNTYGQLGDGTFANKTLPIQIGTASNWQKISAGKYYNLAIKTDGTLWAWGYNFNGQLGDGTSTTAISTPIQIGTANNWQSIATGRDHTLAIRTDGTLWAWGFNAAGQLGDGTQVNKNVPTQIGTATNWQSVTVGQDFTLAIKTNGTLWAWGANWFGQLGDGTTTLSRVSPTQIGSQTDWQSVSAGYNHSVAKKANGLLYTWGYNAQGQLGDGTTTNRNTPTLVFDQIQSIDAGESHTVVILTTGSLLACGANNNGQLGDGTTTNRTSLIAIGTATDRQLVSAGGYHTSVINVDGFLTACGSNDGGQIGDGTNIQRNTLTTIACPVMAIENFATANELKLYPNPIKDVLNLSFDKEITAVSIYNLLGQEVLTKSINANEGAVDTSNLASGTYMVKVTSNDEVKTLKVIKE